MNNLKNIYKLAKKNNKTGNMTYKEFKELMKAKGISNKDIKESLLARNYASLVFYAPKPLQVLLDPDMPKVESESFSYNRAIPIASYSPEYYNLLEVKVPSNPILVPIKGRNKAAEIEAAKKAKEMTEEMLSNYTTQLFNKIRLDAEWRNWNNVDRWNTSPKNTRNYGYYQLGGTVKALSSLLDAVMQFVKALAKTLQADPQLVILAAQLNPEALKSAVQVYQESKGDIQKAAQAFAQALQSKAQAAKHGAKLNYIKSLKNQCAEDEELYYYKKGGSVGCGCVKKQQTGGKSNIVNKLPDNSPVKAFKKKTEKYFNGPSTLKKSEIPNKKGDQINMIPENTPNLPNGKYPSHWTADDKIKWERKYGPKDEGAHYAKEEKCGGKMEKKACGGIKFKLAKCGSKMKKHQNGGSLNGIPFTKMEVL